jgi:hypothetical protein
MLQSLQVGQRAVCSCESGGRQPANESAVRACASVQPHMCNLRVHAALGRVLTAATMPESAGVAMGAIIVEMGCKIGEPAEAYIFR